MPNIPNSVLELIMSRQKISKSKWLVQHPWPIKKRYHTRGVVRETARRQEVNMTEQCPLVPWEITHYSVQLRPNSPVRPCQTESSFFFFGECKFYWFQKKSIYKKPYSSPNKSYIKTLPWDANKRHTSNSLFQPPTYPGHKAPWTGDSQQGQTK